MTSERIFTDYEISVWHEYFGEYDIRKTLELKKQYARASRNCLKPTKAQRDAMRVWSYFLRTLRTGTVCGVKVSAKDQIAEILKTSDSFEIAQIDASRTAIFKAVVDINRSLNGSKLQSYYANGTTKRKKRAESVSGYRLIKWADVVAPQVAKDKKDTSQRLSSPDSIKSALYKKAYNHFNNIGKAVLKPNDLAVFRNHSVVIHAIEDLGYRFNHSTANWQLRNSA